MTRSWALAGAMALGGCTGALGSEKDGRPFDPNDETPPRIAILSPRLDSMIDGTSVTITGRAEDDENPVFVSLGGEPVPVGVDGMFTWTGTVEPGAHRFRFEAKDAAEHTATTWTALIAGDLAESGTPVDQAVALSASAEALA